MKLSLKQKALLITVATIIGAVAGSFILAFIVANVTTETLGLVTGAGLCAWFVYIFYAITLNRLEYNEKLKEMTEKKG